ncbi:MAG TPA: hypothetical protein VGM86_10415 [Thermoanaerobaculia bacterium]|jgi:hypothetical protein
MRALIASATPRDREEIRLRALLIFPSASLTFMAGSIGELTALMRAVESSRDKTVQWRYLELVGGPDVIARSRRLLSSVGCEPLLTAGSLEDLYGTPVSTIRKRLERVLRFRPDVVVLSSFRAFVQFPKFPGLIPHLFQLLSRRQIPTLILDPCGDSFLYPSMTEHDVLLPAPFTYRYEPLPHQKTFSSIVSREQEAPPAPDGEWLWLAAPWMGHFLRFQIAERIALSLLAQLAAPVSSLGALGDPRIWCPQCTVMKDNVSFRRLDQIIARKAAVVTANARSVLAARAASWGVPVVVVDPTRLPSKRLAQAHGVSLEDLERARGERIPKFPVPVEAVTLEPGRRAALDALRRVQRNEASSVALRKERRGAYDNYPDFAQVLAEYV